MHFDKTPDHGSRTSAGRKLADGEIDGFHGEERSGVDG